MGEREHELVHLLHIVDRNFKRSIDKKVESTGVYRSQHRLLMMLGRHPCQLCEGDGEGTEGDRGQHPVLSGD